MRNYWIMKNKTKCFVEKIKELIDFKVSKRWKAPCDDDFSWPPSKPCKFNDLERLKCLCDNSYWIPIRPKKEPVWDFNFEIGDRIKKENESLYVKIIEVDRFGIEAAYSKNK